MQELIFNFAQETQRTNARPWTDLQNEIIECRKCPRLVHFRQKVALERKKQFKNFEYWGKPVPSFGDPNARLMIIGLAPGAQGGNRTGRMFTGDGSAKFLFKELHRTGFATQPNSENREDGLGLIDAYITASAHCVPPDNKLTKEELVSCSQYLRREFELLSNLRVILALGKVAFDSVIDFAKTQKIISLKDGPSFKHGKRYKLRDNFPIIFGSYHPSPRNTNTGKLTSSMFLGVLRRVRKELAN